MPRHPQVDASISALLVPWATPEQLQELERHRVAWEAKHGPTDLTRYYTSRWPNDEQSRLYGLDFKAYFEGLPEYFQDMLRNRMKHAAAQGKTDDMPDEYIRLYCLNHMKGRGDSPRSR